MLKESNVEGVAPRSPPVALRAPSAEPGDGTVFQAQLDWERSRTQRVGAGDTAIRIALTDIGRGKAAEAAQQQYEELTRFKRAMVGREMAMIELRRQVNALSRELGRAKPFALDLVDTPEADAAQ